MVDEIIETPNYNQKKREIALYFSEIISFKNDKNRDDFFKILKSNVYLMLYNMIESTVKEILSAVYDQINISNIPYNNLSDSLKGVWESHQFFHLDSGGSNKIMSYKKETHTMIKKVLDRCSVRFNDGYVSISGNADLDAIFKIMQTHGIAIKMDSIGKYKHEFYEIKFQRNNLAHGSTSFVETGRDTTTDQLQKMINDTEKCIDEIIKDVSKYLNQKKYLKMT